MRDGARGRASKQSLLLIQVEDMAEAPALFRTDKHQPSVYPWIWAKAVTLMLYRQNHDAPALVQEKSISRDR